MDDLPEDPHTGYDGLAVRVHEMFLAFRKAGFDYSAALYLACAFGKAVLPPDDPDPD